MQGIVAEILDQLFMRASHFPRIEQPLGLKIAVTLGGVALIGVELWWFLLSKTQAQQAEAHQGIQDITDSHTINLYCEGTVNSDEPKA